MTKVTPTLLDINLLPVPATLDQALPVPNQLVFVYLYIPASVTSRDTQVRGRMVTSIRRSFVGVHNSCYAVPRVKLSIHLCVCVHASATLALRPLIDSIVF